MQKTGTFTEIMEREFQKVGEIKKFPKYGKM